MMKPSEYLEDSRRRRESKEDRRKRVRNGNYTEDLKRRAERDALDRLEDDI